MHRFCRLSTFEKVMTVLCICGILLSATTFYIYQSVNEQTQWVSIDDYIATIDSANADSDSVVSNQPLGNNEDILTGDVEEKVVEENPVDENVVEVKVDQRVNINTATVEQLLELKGIGPTKAKAIIEERNLGGPFKSVEDIMRVKGIGQKTYETIKESLVN